MELTNLGFSQTGWLEGENSAFTLGDEIKIKNVMILLRLIYTCDFKAQFFI
jgi:hypothetical protein